GSAVLRVVASGRSDLEFASIVKPKGGLLHVAIDGVQIAVTVVDIDPVMKVIAEKWYDFQESPNHRIVIEDGVRFLREAARKGAVIVNIITMKDRTGEADRMLFCSVKEENSYLNNRDELYNRYIAVDAALGFQLTLRKKFIPNDLL
ncbi:hypothetical protein GCK32_020443, partial [Trichostrongylus colubriformis]